MTTRDYVDIPRFKWTPCASQWGAVTATGSGPLDPGDYILLHYYGPWEKDRYRVKSVTRYADSDLWQAELVPAPGDEYRVNTRA